MAPAMDEQPRSLRPLQACQPVVTLIGVNLQEPSAKALKEAFSMVAATPWRIVEQQALATMAAVIAGDRAEEALLDLAASGIEHRRGSLAHEQAIRASQMLRMCSAIGLRWKQARPAQLPSVARSSWIPWRA